MVEKNKAAVAMGKLRQDKLRHLTDEQKSLYFSYIRKGMKKDAKLLISMSLGT